MLDRWQYALAIAALAAVVAWAFWPNENSPAVPGPQPPHPASVKNAAPGNSPAPSRFLSSHDVTRSDTPSRQNVDRRFHAEVEQLRETVRTDSNSVDDMLRLARLSQDAHKLDEAITLYWRIVKIEPKNHDAWLDLTRCYGLNNDWAGALRAADDMLIEFPEDPGALYNRGAILANMGNTTEARQVWMKVAAQDKDERLKSMASSSLDQLDLLKE